MTDHTDDYAVILSRQQNHLMSIRGESKVKIVSGDDIFEE